MFGFEELSQTSGVDLLAQPHPFMTVPLRGPNFIFRDLMKGSQLPTGNHFVDVKDITDIPAGRFVMDLAQGDLLAGLFAFVGMLPPGSMRRLLVITGKIPGITTLGANPDKIDVAVLRPKTAAVTMKFLHYLDQDGGKAGTTWTPADADRIISAMNNIYSQQANITFKLHKADPLEINEHFGPIIMDEVYDKYLKDKLDKDADVTVLFVGRWAHSRVQTANATTNHYGKNHVIVINDKPTGEGVKDIDPFELTLAHELAHSLGVTQGGVDGHGHQKRNHVLLSAGQQSLKISKDIARIINPWDGEATRAARH